MKVTIKSAQVGLGLVLMLQAQNDDGSAVGACVFDDPTWNCPPPFSLTQLHNACEMMLRPVDWTQSAAGMITVSGRVKLNGPDAQWTPYSAWLSVSYAPVMVATPGKFTATS